MDQNQQGAGSGRGRRGHFHRGRRGPDRRGPGTQEPRTSQPPEQHQSRGEHVDVEQIMRDIRARIAQRHGIDLSPQQISELAARRLEAILDPRNVSPTLLEQLRKAAGTRAVTSAVGGPVEPAYTFEDTTLYDTHRGLLGAIRKLLNPILRLFFNPTAIAHALNAQTRLNAEYAARDAEREQEQAEWNALHYELLKRVVTESAKLSVELQALTLRVESLSTRVDFADRRVRAFESVPAQRHNPRPVQEAHQAPLLVNPAPGEPALPGLPSPSVPPDAASPEGQRKRRRRRRGRRNGGSFGEGNQVPGSSAANNTASADDLDDSADDGSDAGPEGDFDAVAVEPVTSAAQPESDRVTADASASAPPPAPPEARQPSHTEDDPGPESTS